MFKINGYKVECSEKLKKELIEDVEAGNIFNWCNFNANDTLWDYNGNPYRVRQIDHGLKCIAFVPIEI